MTDQPTAGVALKPCPKCGADSFATNGKGDQNIVCSVCWTSRPEYYLATRTPASGPVEADDRLAVALEAFRVLADETSPFDELKMPLQVKIAKDLTRRIEIAAEALALLTSGEQPVTDPYKLEGGEAGGMSDLILPLKGEYFDAIRDGSKVEEYRLANAYWTRRLEGRSFDRIVLTKGYPKRGDDSRRLVRQWKGFTRKTLTHPHFGPDPVEVFAIKVSHD